MSSKSKPSNVELDEISIDVLEENGPQKLPGEAEAAEAHKRKQLMVVGVVFAVFILLVLFAAAVSISIFLAVSLSHKEGPPPPEYFHHTDLLPSVEFQIALNPKPDWSNRTAMIEHWIYSMNLHSNVLNISLGAATEKTYVQRHINATTFYCGVSEDISIRARSYRGLNSTVIDIKTEEDINKRGACQEPFWPAAEFVDVSRQKCEEDVHPCFNKYARGTSVVFENDYHKKLTTCGELVEIFPDAFPTITEENWANELDTKGAHRWWRMQWKGVVGNHTNYEVTFGIHYPKETSWDEIDAGLSPIEEGEWSLRFYPEAGTEHETEITADLQATFYDLVAQYDTYEDHVICAHKFALGVDDHHIGFH